MKSFLLVIWERFPKSDEAFKHCEKETQRKSCSKEEFVNGPQNYF